MKKITVISIILITALLASCNLDSNQGVMQMAFNATHKTSYTIIDVYGAYDNGTKILMNRDGDLWYAETVDNNIVQHKVKDLTQDSVTPIFINSDGTLFYAYRPERKEAFSFGSANINEIADENFDFSKHLTESAELENITKFDPVNLNLDECLIIWGTDDATYYSKIENKASVSSFSLSSVPLVDITSFTGRNIDSRGVIIFGTDALFTYYEDSDLENTPDQLAVIRIVDGQPEAITLGVDTDNIPMGYDNGYFITFDGDLYQFDRDQNNGYRRIRGFASDLRYRINHRLVLANDDSSRTVGFIYRNGVYVRENDGNNTLPRIISINNNDNDIICSSYIGRTTHMKGDVSYDRYLFATQNNSFIILEVGPGTLNADGTRYNYTVDDSMLQAYNPRVHGQITEYTI